VHAIRRLLVRRAVARRSRRPRLTAGWFVAALWIVLAAAAPGPGAEREASLAFLGETGTGERDQKRVRDQVGARAPALVFLLGDNLDDLGSALLIKERFDAVYGPLMAKGAEFHACLGTHDVQPCRVTDSDPLPVDANAYRWREPGCDVEFQLSHRDFGYRDTRRYYSVVSDDTAEPLVEVFVLDSNTLHVRDGKLRVTREDTAQVDWLDEALGASRAHWKVVALHHPPQSPRGRGSFLGRGGHDREPGLEAQLGPLFRKHAVDAVFAGHNRFYARLAPRDGARFFVSGGGGRPLYDMDKAAAGYLAVAGKFHHFVYVRVTASRFEYYAIDDAGRSRDAGWFAKGDETDTALPVGALPPP
jgi:hypothetical protein